MARESVLHVDLKPLQSTIEGLRAVHTKKEFELLMLRAFRRTGQRVKTILKTEIPKDYHAKPMWIGQSVGRPETGFGGIGGAAVHCTIPIDGPRGVHGRQFHAAGPPGRRAKGKRYKISVNVVKGKQSVLPETMKNQGGNPPFIAKARASGATKIVRGEKGRFAKGNISGNTKGIVFTRRTGERLPSVRVVGQSVPQMPMNKSKEDVQEEILEHLKGRIEHEHRYMIGAIKSRR